jgi:tRNA U34 5-methylaminomethyl-2-thiouridine-forming methyltransferase MnmC
MYQPFDQLPDSSRIWIYASTRKFSVAEQEVIRKTLQDFCAVWATHGTEMPSSFEILHEQLLVLAVDESQLGASGCSIDSSVRALRVLPALGLKSKIANGQITPDLEVVQPALQTKADLRSLWIPVRKSWLSSYFPN